jgi:hypothetical protein
LEAYMKIWQVDFYRRPLKNQQPEVWWELVICDVYDGLRLRTRSFTYEVQCRQSEANVTWIVSQLQEAAGNAKHLPDIIQVFRPQSFNLIELAGKQLNIKVEATRHTYALKELLQDKAEYYSTNGENYNPLALDKPPPTPLPENLLGEQWRFATLPAGELVEAFAERPIPVIEMSESLLPINLGLASTIAVPGVIIYGGRQSMRLARWLEEAKPVSLNFIIGEPAGLVLEAGLVDRWVVATFEDQEVVKSAQMYEQRKQLSKGLHFLLVQPDDSGVTYSGFWLLKAEDL